MIWMRAQYLEVMIITRLTLNLFLRGFLFISPASSLEELNLSGTALDEFIKSRNADLAIKAVKMEKKIYALKNAIASGATAISCRDTIGKALAERKSRVPSSLVTVFLTIMYGMALSWFTWEAFD